MYIKRKKFSLLTEEEKFYSSSALSSTENGIAEERFYFLAPISKGDSVKTQRAGAEFKRSRYNGLGSITGKEVHSFAKQKGISYATALKQLRRDEAVIGANIDFSNKIGRGANKLIRKVGDIFSKDATTKLIKYMK